MACPGTCCPGLILSTAMVLLLANYFGGEDCARGDPDDVAVHPTEDELVCATAKGCRCSNYDYGCVCGWQKRQPRHPWSKVYKNVGGLDLLKKQIDWCILHCIKHPNVYKNVEMLPFPELLNKYIGESESGAHWRIRNEWCWMDENYASIASEAHWQGKNCIFFENVPSTHFQIANHHQF
uniref:Uncharacterized protein n=1 Tax=Aegilops tauschii TaxID=37682 RepID=R7WFK9_AEGTA